MYSLFNIQTLFQQENDIYKELVGQNVQDPDLLNKISQEITTQPSLRVKIIPFLKYLTLDTSHRLLEKLSCINTYFMAYLADEQVQSIIFMYCFKIWDSGQDVFDAEVHHLLYSILERCKISAELWEEELNKSNYGKKAKSLEMYDNMIEDYLFNPCDNYPKNVHLDKDVNITASARFSLFNVLYAKDMRPIHFTNDELFKLSDECIALIQQLDKSTFLIETKMVESSLRNSKLKCYSMKQTINLTNTKMITTMDTLDTMMRECCNLLIHAPMFVQTITLCLIHLLHYAKNNCTEESYHQYTMMCQAAWLKIFQTLLNNLVFLNPQKSQSYTTFPECCACFLQFQRYAQCNDMSDFHQHINAIWADYMKKRLIYLNSTDLKDDKLPWLKQLFIASTISNSNN